MSLNAEGSANASRHRALLAALIPVTVFVVATVIGGLANQVDMRGRVTEEYTGDGVVATLTFGSRSVDSAADGSFVFTGLPRFDQVRVDSRGYQRLHVATTQSDVVLHPLAFTVYVREQGTESKLIPHAEIRLDGKLIATANQSGNTVISPHPGPGKTLLVCAPGYAPKAVPDKGVLVIVDLAPGGSGCPPLSTP